MNTAKIIKILTITTTALAAVAAGLGTLPIDSASLPMPPSWRPYLMGIAFFATALRIVALPVLENIIKSFKDEE